MNATRVGLFCLFLLVAGCGGGGGGASPSAPAGSTAGTGSGATGGAGAGSAAPAPGWVTIAATTSTGTTAESVYVSGRAFVSAQGWSCCTGLASDTGVTMAWRNVDTGESGAPTQHPNYVWFLRYILDTKGQDWDAQIPLRVGSNTIVVTATAPGVDEGRATIVVVRTPDQERPIVTATTPGNGATGVGTTSSLTITFSEAMDPASLSSATILVRDSSNNPVAGNVAYANGVVTFTPLSALKELLTYALTVTADVADTAGNKLAQPYVATFGTAAGADTARPVVTVTTPGALAACVPVETDITVRFSKPLAPDTLAGGFELSASGHLTPVAGTLLPDTTTWAEVTFRPSQALASSTSYVARVKQNITDTSGNGLAQPVSWQFQTAPSGVGSWAGFQWLGQPKGGAGHSAVWTGTELLIWGGSVNGWGATATGARYRPDTDTWVPMSTEGAPSARMGHAAVWTGSRMIVWGGNDGMFQYLNSGASYDPATDTWSSIDTAGAPQARSDAMVVWTGSEMIVWGGVGHALPIRMLADGARYSPATNRWTPVATRGAPSARALSATAWTGNRMMVWGGANTASVDIPALKDLDRRAEFSDTGALYDPVADAWTPMPRAGAPSPRAHAPAVWSGSELIVWGGYDGTPLGDGARFDPLSGTWRPVGSGCAPLPRFGHQAVWTGARMVVWGGGRGADRLYQIGGVYDAATDSWQPMRGGASLPAQFPSAVWSGTEVLMYGSGRYRP